MKKHITERQSLNRFILDSFCVEEIGEHIHCERARRWQGLSRQSEESTSVHQCAGVSIPYSDPHLRFLFLAGELRNSVK